MEGVNELLERFKVPLLLSLVGAVLLVGGLFSSGVIGLNSNKKSYPRSSTYSAQQPARIKVDLAGAVQQPGVYSLDSTARVEDLVKAGGGFTDSVNKEFISKSLNLSQKLSDGQKIYIPYEGESGAVSPASSTNAKVGINSASLDQLDSLPGVGPATAQKIVSLRPYATTEEMVSKKAITRATFDKIKELIDLN